MDIYKNERWKDIESKDFATAHRYQVSDRGRIKSFAIDKENGEIIEGSTLKGYKAVNLRMADDRRVNKYVHKLVAQAFLKGESENHKYVIHIDYDKSNNHVSNLKWVSRDAMYKHSNNNPAVIKRKTTGYKLTEAKVRIIKRLLKSDKTRLSMIAKRFGITHTQLNRIRSGENWGHVEAE